MKAKAAVLWEAPGEWDVVEVDVAEPQEREVLVKWVSAGLCHSEDHVAKGDVVVPNYPFCGGHEGAGIVQAVGPGVREVSPGDHIVAGFIPVCGRCKWCARGQQNLCDNGRLMLQGTQLDGTYRMHIDGKPVAQCGVVGTFAELSVIPELSAIKIDPAIPLASAAIVGCAVPTGWGSAVNAADVSPGDIVIVMGVGGIGINAVQGAKFAGASRVIAVDPVAFKRDLAVRLGATDAVATAEEADELAKSLTNGQGADSAIICIGVVEGHHAAQAFKAIRKAGTVVVVGTGDMSAANVPISLVELTLFQKRIQGALFGMMPPTSSVGRLLDLYQAGHLRLDEIVTHRYKLEDINQGYADLLAGKTLRGVIDFD